MGLIIEYGDGQTPIDEDEKEGLRIKSISTRSELDEFEQLNIEEAIKWTLGKKWKAENILTEEFVKELHYRMFKTVWVWAGEFRKSNKNIGVDKFQIGISLKQLIDDSKFWLEKSIHSHDEFAIHFKHRIVKIHCFANGNGRHSRLMADVVISHIFEKQIFTWNKVNLNSPGESRSSYLNALREADKGNINPLIEFART